MPFSSGRALLIGVGTYMYASHINVPVTADDAEQVGRVLRNQKLCGYPDDQVMLLRNATAGRQQILDALDALQQSNSDDTVLIFFSGHGGYGTDGHYYLTTYDTQLVGGKVKAGTGVAAAELIDKLRGVRSKRLLLLLNACYSGEISPSLDLTDDEASLRGEPLPDEAADAILSTGEGRVLITACRSNQRSLIGAGPVTIYAQALVDGMSGKGYVTTSGGYVSAFNLYEHIYFAVKEAALKFGKTQEPEISVLKGVGPFPVSLYRGATDLSLFPADESLPEGTATRVVEPERSRRLLDRYVRSVVVTVSGERAVAPGGSIQRSIVITGDGNVVN